MDDDGPQGDQDLDQGPHTFTSERVKDQLHRDRFIPNSSSHHGYPPTMRCDFTHYTCHEDLLQSYSEQQKASVRDNFCRSLFNEVQDPSSHLEGLDRVLLV